MLLFYSKDVNDGSSFFSFSSILWSIFENLVNKTLTMKPFKWGLFLFFLWIGSLLHTFYNTSCNKVFVYYINIGLSIDSYNYTSFLFIFENLVELTLEKGVSFYSFYGMVLLYMLSIIHPVIECLFIIIILLFYSYSRTLSMKLFKWVFFYSFVEWFSCTK